MLWRCNWVKQRKKILNTLSFSSIHAQFSQKVRKTGQLSRRVSPKPLTHDDVYSRLRESPSDLKTLDFFFWCSRQNNYFHDDRAFDHMVGVVEKLTREYNSVDRIVEELQKLGCEIKPGVFLLLLEIFWRGHIYDKATEVFNGMNRFGYVPNTRAMNMMMDFNFKKAQLFDQALQIFDGIPVRNFFTFDIALSHLCSREDLVRVKKVLKMMITEGFYPNCERFGQVLEIFCRAGCVVEGLQVVGLMISSGISVSVNVWSMLLSGFFRSGEPQKAVDLFGKMTQIGCSPNLVTYTSLIKGLMDFGMVNEAFSVLRTVQSRGLVPDIVLCNVMIHTFTRLGRSEDALKVFTSLKEMNLVADGYTIASFLSSLCLSGDSDMFTSIADGIATELDLVTGNSLLNYFCKIGNTPAAVKLVRDMFSIDLVDCYTLTGYLTALCRGGKPRKAVSQYKGIIMKRVHLDAHVHTALIDCLIECGEYNTAIHLFKRCILEKYPLDVVSYTVAIKGLVLANRIDEAYSLLYEMKEDGVFPNGRTYRTIISGLCREKDKCKVKKIVLECMEEGVELDVNTKIKVFSLLSRSRRDFSEFRWVFEKWKPELMEKMHVSESNDELSVSVG